MAMGTRKHRQRQEQLWVTHTELATAPGHPFYKRLSQVLDGEKFDEFCERECAQFYADHNGRPSLTPGIYFRLLLVGYSLRANIDETESAAIITEQGGQENHRERSQDGSSFCNQFA